MKGNFSPGADIAVFAMLAAGGAVAYLAGRLRWRPPLWAAVLVGLALRVAVLLATYNVRPYDFVNDFYVAGVNVLHHQDLILHARPTGWNYLPLYGFVLAAEVKLHAVAHISWMYAGRIFPILADLGVIVLVGVIAGDRDGPLRRFQYACYPIAIIESAAHGQIEPTCLLLALGALAIVLRSGSAITTGRTLASGLLLGLAIGAKTWPVLFAPALWRGLPSARERIRCMLAAGVTVAALFATMPLTVGTPVRDLLRDAKTIAFYHPAIGTWGWSAVITHLYGVLPGSRTASVIGWAASALTLVAVVAAVWWWRRGHPLDLATVAPGAFLLTTASFGVQYLMWPAATLIARPTKRSGYFHVIACAWAYFGEVGISGFTWHEHRALLPDVKLTSILVIPAIAVALPWERRRGGIPPDGAPAPGTSTPAAGPEPELVPGP
jgi:Glycosyltransferase family 87